MGFSAIRGHVSSVQMLKNILSSGRVPHAMLFSGIEGIGKKKAAFSFAKAINCQEREEDFCDVCLSCRKINRMIHPDVFLFDPDEEPADKKKKEYQIDRLRRLQQEIVYSPFEGKKKVVIIDDAEKLTNNSANCFLKTLEEPDADTVIILVTQSDASMLPTVVSRCQRIVFMPLADTEMRALLADRKISERILDREAVGREEIDRVIPYAQGSLKRAAFLLTSDFLSKRMEVCGCLARLSKGDSEAVFELAKMIHTDNSRWLLFEFLQTWYRDILFIKEGIGESSRIYNRDLLEQIVTAAENESLPAVISKIKKLQFFNDHPASTLNIELGMQNLFTQEI